MKLKNSIVQLINIGLILSISSCIDVIDFTVDESPDQIVIVGAITTDPGPYTVSITKALDFYAFNSNLSDKISDACVTISSDDGQVEELESKGSGIYESHPTGMRGEIGKSYAITVETMDGEIYQSKRETIVESPSIDSLYFVYEVKEELQGNIVVGKEEFVAIMLQTTDDPDIDNYYEWSWRGTYQFETSPHLFISGRDALNIPIITPLPCSAPVCSCCTCWLTEEKNDLVIANDRLSNGNKITNQRVATIPITSEKFQTKYHVTVVQKSLSKDAYEFWKLIKDQETTATLFATPPARIASNFININDPDELVWGYFSASDVTEKSFFIDKNELPTTVPTNLQVLTEDCRKAKTNATSIQPNFWQ